MNKKKILFLKAGSFSHINNAVLESMKTIFDDCEIVVIDVNKEIKKMNPLQLLRSIFWAIFSLKSLSWKGIKSAFRISPFYWDLSNQLVRRKINNTNFQFSFQMQSNIDGNTGICPHFVYTDHTHLVNLSYPGFKESNLNSKKWIDKERKLYERSAGIFTMSNHVRNSLIQQYNIGPEKVKCVFAGANISQPDKTYPLSRYQSKKILFVGVDWERKGGPELLEAFKLLLKKHPDAQLDIVGCRPSIDLSNVRIWGKLPLEDVKRFYESGTVFCMPSKREPFGIVYLEAMAFKLPIVALHIGALPDFVDEGETGFLLEYKDIEGLSARMTFLLENPLVCQQMGEKAYQKFVGQYNWQQSVQSIKDYMIETGVIE